MEVIMWCYGLLSDLKGMQQGGAIALILIAAILIFKVHHRLKCPKK